MTERSWDLIIVGGGPAGMSAALIAGRARLRTLIVNGEAPRNIVTTASHGFLTRDGAHPTELLAASKAQLKKYATVEYRNGLVDRVGRAEGEFFAEIAGESLSTKRIVLATGFRDELSMLRLPGIEKVYGKSMYPCPFCDGFEHADERIAVFGGEGVEHFASVVAVWTDDIIVFTNGEELPPDSVKTLDAAGVRVVSEKVERLASDAGGRLTSIVLSDGTEIGRDAGFLGGDFSVPANSFAEDLGVAKTTNDWGMEVYEADVIGKTNVPGVYVVGDARVGFGGLIASAHEGAWCRSTEGSSASTVTNTSLQGGISSSTTAMGTRPWRLSWVGFSSLLW